jgi:hypothetical protein
MIGREPRRHRDGRDRPRARVLELVEVKGRYQHSYERRGEEPVRVHDGDVFVSVSTGPTPLS